MKGYHYLLLLLVCAGSRLLGLSIEDPANIHEGFSGTTSDVINIIMSEAPEGIKSCSEGINPRLKKVTRCAARQSQIASREEYHS
jgi:hypothetical protein